MTFQLRSFSFALVVLIAIGGATGAEPKLLAQKLLDEGWIQLFDGETLFGWQPTGEAKWEVVDGEIRTTGEQPGFLMTTTEWADYQLHVEFKAPAKTNSGIFLRTPMDPKDPKTDCYELNIAPPDNPFPTGSLVGLQKAGSEQVARIKPEQWQSFDVMAAPEGIVIAFDGKPAVTQRNPAIRMGHIGLQSREGPIAFRTISLRPLGLKPIFNGKSLDGWNSESASKSKFEVAKNGEMHVANGPGQLSTNDEYKNFILQLECKVNGDGLNSGVFYRILDNGPVLNGRPLGYECQINNRFKNSDRTKPADQGTGAIYRRQQARRIVADDRVWFTETLVVNGPHMAAWVNGYQVSDWTDERPVNENPREGRRDAGGAIAIQGHDPTTDFLFRNIRVVELPR